MRILGAAIALFAVAGCQPPAKPATPDAEPPAAAPVQQILYQGVAIGSSQDEVLSARGAPSQVLEAPMPGGSPKALPVDASTIVRDYRTWIYAAAGDKTTVHFEDDRVARIICEAEPDAAKTCAPFLDVAIGDTQERIVAALGPAPLPGALPNERPALWFESKGVALYLSHGRVNGISVSQPRDDRAAE